MSKLFSPYELKGKTIKTAGDGTDVYVPAENGLANDWHLTHYLTRAVGESERLWSKQPGFCRKGALPNRTWDCGTIPKLRLKTHCRGSSQIRLFNRHSVKSCGRKSQTNGTILPRRPWLETMQLPAELTKADIRRVVESFRQAAIRADCAGFDFIQIHGAHGYLINNFVAPGQQTDRRIRRMFTKRTRFLHEIIEAITRFGQEKFFASRFGRRIPSGRKSCG